MEQNDDPYHAHMKNFFLEQFWRDLAIVYDNSGRSDEANKALYKRNEYQFKE